MSTFTIDCEFDRLYGKYEVLAEISDLSGMGTCKLCNQPLPAIAEFCSSCGEPAVRSGEPAKRSPKRAILIVVIALLGCLILVICANAVDAVWRWRNPEAAAKRDAEVAAAQAGVVRAQADDDERYRAVGLAKDAVRARLKAPDTAEFTETKTGRYMGAVVIFGTVTAKNAFGVPLRSRWRAEVHGDTVGKVTISGY